MKIYDSSRQGTLRLRPWAPMFLLCSFLLRRVLVISVFSHALCLLQLTYDPPLGAPRVHDDVYDDRRRCLSTFLRIDSKAR